MKIVISGMGIQCALGNSLQELWDGVEQGKSGISLIKRFDVSIFEPKYGGMVPGGDNIESNEERLFSYARKAAEEALNDAGITDKNEVSLVLGTSNGLRGRKICDISNTLADLLNLGGQVLSVSTACTSSSHAIGFAADLLRRGKAKIVIAGGVDLLTMDVFAGFYCLGLLSTMPCAPFSNTLGTTLGEGAAFLVMETEYNACQRGIQPKAVFMGYGMAADAFHDTKPDPGGSGIQRAVTSALRNSNLKPDDIGYVNAHGTGTAANDSAEWRGIQNALSRHSAQLPVSSSKSYFGHGQGAAGAMEAVTTIYSMLHNVIPTTLNYSKPRPFSPVDPVADILPRHYITKYALSTNSAFGGLNTALIFGRGDIDYKPPKESPRPISVVGYGINVDPDYITNFIPYEDLRSTDLSAKLLAGVVAMVLNNAGVQFRSDECEKIGLFVAQDHLSEDSLQALDTSIKERGIKHLSASAFTRLVVNYPAGACCRLFGIKGPVAVMAAKPDSGMTALSLAADFLAWRKDTDMIIVASVDDIDHGKNKPAGAVGFLLKAGDEKSSIRLKSWSMSQNYENQTEEGPEMRPGMVTLNKNSSPASEGLCAVVHAIEEIKNSKGHSVVIRTGMGINHLPTDIIIERNETYAC
jgi:3-oxoacyl-[acyl-carrier-protein] synthase II